jgi:hypothetical protein
MIREIKQPKRKTHKVLEELLIDALSDVRKNKATSIALSINYKNRDAYTDYALDRGGSYADAIAGLERCKARIMREWLKQ